MDDASVIRVTEVDPEVLVGGAEDVYAYDVTCLKLGEGKITFVVGNNRSATNTYVISWLGIFSSLWVWILKISSRSRTVQKKIMKCIAPQNVNWELKF